jgi:hypothetical protein
MSEKSFKEDQSDQEDNYESDEEKSDKEEDEEKNEEEDDEDKVPRYILRQVYEHYVKTKTLVIQKRYKNIPNLTKQVSDYVNDMLLKEMNNR